MNYCPNCGEKLTEEFTFCPKCGEQIPDHDTGIAQPTASHEDNKNKRITTGGLVTMLWCFATAAFFFFMAFGPWELRLFSILGDGGHYLNMIFFSAIGIAAVIFGIKEFFSKDKLFK